MRSAPGVPPEYNQQGRRAATCHPYTPPPSPLCLRADICMEIMLIKAGCPSFSSTRQLHNIWKDCARLLAAAEVFVEGLERVTEGRRGLWAMTSPAETSLLGDLMTSQKGTMAPTRSSTVRLIPRATGCRFQNGVKGEGPLAPGWHGARKRHLHPVAHNGNKAGLLTVPRRGVVNMGKSSGFKTKL